MKQLDYRDCLITNIISYIRHILQNELVVKAKRKVFFEKCQQQVLELQYKKKTKKQTIIHSF